MTSVLSHDVGRGASSTAVSTGSVHLGQQSLTEGGAAWPRPKIRALSRSAASAGRPVTDQRRPSKGQACGRQAERLRALRPFHMTRPRRFEESRSRLKQRTPRVSRSQTVPGDASLAHITPFDAYAHPSRLRSCFASCRLAGESCDAGPNPSKVLSLFCSKQ